MKRFAAVLALTLLGSYAANAVPVGYPYNGTVVVRDTAQAASAPSNVMKALPGANVRICAYPVIQTNPCFPLANVFDSSGAFLTQPFTADSSGNILYFVIPGSIYYQEVSYTGYTTYGEVVDKTVGSSWAENLVLGGLSMPFSNGSNHMILEPNDATSWVLGDGTGTTNLELENLFVDNSAYAKTFRFSNSAANTRALIFSNDDQLPNLSNTFAQSVESYAVPPYRANQVFRMGWNQDAFGNHLDATRAVIGIDMERGWGNSNYGTADYSSEMHLRFRPPTSTNAGAEVRVLSWSCWWSTSHCIAGFTTDAFGVQLLGDSGHDTFHIDDDTAVNNYFQSNNSFTFRDNATNPFLVIGGTTGPNANTVNTYKDTFIANGMNGLYANGYVYLNNNHFVLDTASNLTISGTGSAVSMAPAGVNYGQSMWRMVGGTKNDIQFGCQNSYCNELDIGPGAASTSYGPSIQMKSSVIQVWNATPVELNEIDTTTGSFSFKQTKGHINQQAANSDIAGYITLSVQTTVGHTFAQAYANAPACTLTPNFDYGTAHYWVTTSTTAVTVNFSAAQTGNVFYHCIGNPN